MFALIFVASVSLLVRLHHARGVERQQIKWVAYAGAPAASASLPTYTIFEAMDVRWLEMVGYVPALVGIVGVPTAVGIAILRYRLYEIDLLINRTLVYSSLTAILVAHYFGSIVWLQMVFVELTGQRPTLAVVASTLVIAALFNPLHRWVQAFVDRRFYRRKYNARKTSEAFSAKLRDETDLDALRDDLVGVVRETMQPEHISLWLRLDPTRRAVKARSQENNAPMNEAHCQRPQHRKPPALTALATSKSSGDSASGYGEIHQRIANFETVYSCLGTTANPVEFTVT